MPGTLGLDFMLHVRESRPSIISILLTAQADVGMVITAMNEGRLHRFFTKPWDGDELRGALRSLLGLPNDVDSRKRDRASVREAQLQRAMSPQQDDDGSWVIIPPGADGQSSLA